MLKINFLRMCKLRAVDKPYTFLVRNGISHEFAHKIINEKAKYFRTEHIYKICYLLKCTPNDLFEYVPKRETPGHPLNELIKAKDEVNYTHELQTLPIEDLKVIQETIKKLKNKDSETGQNSGD